MRKSRKQLHALPVPEMEHIANGRFQTSQESDVRAATVPALKACLVVCVRTMSNKRYDDRTRHKALEPAGILSYVRPTAGHRERLRFNDRIAIF
jgi:hypothetical protein